jgi:hypothetical protein
MDSYVKSIGLIRPLIRQIRLIRPIRPIKPLASSAHSPRMTIFWT